MRAAQLHAILQLRFWLFRNQLFRGGTLNRVLSLIVGVGGVVLVAGGGAGAFLAGALAMKGARADTFLLVWHALCLFFVFFWLIAFMVELQRAELIDMTRFLHLPVSLRGVFLMNYLASHLSLPALMFLPAMAGLGLGIALSGGWTMVPVLLAVGGFVFLVTAWTYCLRGWLGALMSNPRRRRTVIVAFTLVMMAVFQAPNLYFNLARKQENSKRTESSIPKSRKRGPPREFLAVHPYLPPLWPGHAAYHAARGNSWLGFGYGALAFLGGGIGLALSYRSTLRFYRGHTRARLLPAVSAPKAARRSGPLLVERSPPGLPPQTAALALAMFRSLTRAPELRLFLGTNLIVLLVFGALLFMRVDSFPSMVRPFVVTASISVSFFALLQLLINQFGFDRDGFRTLILMPVPRHHTLLAKNLAVLPIAAALVVLVSVLPLVLTGFSLALVLAAGFQFLTAFFLLSIAGNVISILVPYRIEPGSMRRNKTDATTTLVAFVTHLVFPFLAVPIFLGPGLGLVAEHMGFLSAAWTNLLVSASLGVLAVVAYGLSLRPLGGLLQRREQSVLLKVTREQE